MGHKTPSVRPPRVDDAGSGEMPRGPSTIVDAGSGEMPRGSSTIVDGLAWRLAELCSATALGPEATDAADSIFRNLIVPWSRVEEFARQPVSSWVSEISDDNTPIEFSVTLSPEGSEVRVLFEPQSELQTIGGHRESALRMHEQLARDYGADLTRFRRVQDLFTPPDMQGPFALWSAVVFASGKAPSFKAYFSPQAQGPGNAVALVEEALRRLGMRKAWRSLAATLARRGPHRDELKYFALDLTASDQARVKVYVRHHEATPEDLEIAASAASDSTPGETADFARAMSGGARRFVERATFTCAAFVEGQDERPSATTQYVPVCAYATDDQQVRERVSNYLRNHDLDHEPYERVLRAFANRQFQVGVGMQSWVAFRRYRGVPRLTIYLGSETGRVFAPGSVPAATRDHMSFSSAKEVLACVARYGLDEHPLLRNFERLAEQPELLFLTVSNTYELLTKTSTLSVDHLGTWLARHQPVALTPEQEACRHLFAGALQGYRSSPDPFEAKAAELTATQAARGLAKLLAELLETEETSSIGFSLDAILRAGPEADASRLSQLEAGGVVAVPGMVRGALGVHQALWAALDRLAALAPVH